MNHPKRSQRWLLPAAGLGGVLAVFAIVIAGGALTLRGRLRAEALHQEATSLESLVLFQLDAQAGDVNRVDLAGTEAAAFSAVLDSSRMRGVIAVRLFDGHDQLASCLPALAVDATLSPDLAKRARDEGEACARLYPNALLADHLGTEGLAAGKARGTLLEVVVPIPQSVTGNALPIAQYWIDGSSLQKSFSAMDRQLAGQAGIVFATGSAAIVLCLAWVYRRLRAAERDLEERTLDLGRANAELVFAAKASAIGAVSAHLLHGLKNPVAGIDGFLADAMAGAEPAGQGEALREARETTRRISDLLKDVSAILKEEGGAPGASPVRLGDEIALLRKVVEPRADKSGVTLAFSTEVDPEIDPRVASLCRLALQNLVENAIDATPRGGRVEVLIQKSDDGSVTVDVVDQGAGFSPEEREHLFQPKRSAKPGGSGLGLAISWHLVRHAGGELRLAQTGPLGSRLRLRLPTTIICI